MALEQVVHGRAVRVKVPAIVMLLQDVLRQRLVAAIADMSDAKAIGKWAQGGRSPNPHAEQRLRRAFEIVQLLPERESTDTIRA